MSLVFDFEKLAEKMHETFSRNYHTKREVRESIEDLKRTRRCLEEDPNCPLVFKIIIECIITQSWYFGKPKNFDEEIGRFIERYGVKGLLTGKGREELLRYVGSIVSPRRKEGVKEKVKAVLDHIQEKGSIREWVNKLAEDIKEGTKPRASARLSSRAGTEEEGTKLLGEKGLRDFLRSAGRWKMVPIDIHEQRFIIRTGIYLAHSEPQKFDPTDKSFLREALKTFASKYLKGKTIAGIDLGENPGVLDAFIYTHCSPGRDGKKYLEICAKEPKCEKCRISGACLHSILTTRLRT